MGTASGGGSGRRGASLVGAVVVRGRVVEATEAEDAAVGRKGKGANQAIAQLTATAAAAAANAAAFAAGTSHLAPPRQQPAALARPPWGWLAGRRALFFL